MRIISGTLKGRVLKDPKSHRTHPMGEKIRGALFNSLGPINGMTVLDAFTGSGAIAVEAVSRGASKVVAIDNDLEAYKCASKNVALVNLQDRIDVFCTNTKSWSNNNLSKKFDIVIADPPFDVVNDALLEKVGRHVKSEGLFIVSIPGDYKTRKNADFTLISQKDYGDATLAFYRKIS